MKNSNRAIENAQKMEAVARNNSQTIASNSWAVGSQIMHTLALIIHNQERIEKKLDRYASGRNNDTL